MQVAVPGYSTAALQVAVPHGVPVQAKIDLVQTADDTGPAPAVPVGSPVLSLLPALTPIQGSTRSITKPSESLKRLESNVFVPRNNKNLHRDRSGVPNPPRGQPADHVGLHTIEEAFLQTRSAAGVRGAQAGEHRAQSSETVAPLTLEGTASVLQNPAPDAATQPDSEKAKPGRSEAIESTVDGPPNTHDLVASRARSTGVFRRRSESWTCPVMRRISIESRQGLMKSGSTRTLRHRTLQGSSSVQQKQVIRTEETVFCLLTSAGILQRTQA